MHVRVRGYKSCAIVRRIALRERGRGRREEKKKYIYIFELSSRMGIPKNGENYQKWISRGIVYSVCTLGEQLEDYSNTRKSIENYCYGNVRKYFEVPVVALIVILIKTFKLL